MLGPVQRDLVKCSAVQCSGSTSLHAWSSLLFLLRSFGNGRRLPVYTLRVRGEGLPDAFPLLLLLLLLPPLRSRTRSAKSRRVLSAKLETIVRSRGWVTRICLSYLDSSLPSAC